MLIRDWSSDVCSSDLFYDRHVVLVLAAGAVLLLDLPLDRQAVAVPAGHVDGLPPGHVLRAVDDVLEDLVQRVADVQVAVRVGRPVMQDENGRASWRERGCQYVSVTVVAV